MGPVVYGGTMQTLLPESALEVDVVFKWVIRCSISDLYLSKYVFQAATKMLEI